MQMMIGEGAYQFGRSDLEAVLFADNEMVRARFKEAFADLIQQFLDQSDRVCDQLRRFERVDIREAWVEKFIFSAFNNCFVSCHLFISGFMVPAGNLMRHYAEASAMALLCSHRAIDVLKLFDQDPSKFPVHKAVQLVLKRRNTDLLKINAQGWASFEAISKWYDKYSHAGYLTFADQIMFATPGDIILGGKFDDGKREAYRKELGLRVSAMDQLNKLSVAVQENVRAAQAKSLVISTAS